MTPDYARFTARRPPSFRSGCPGRGRQPARDLLDAVGGLAAELAVAGEGCGCQLASARRIAAERVQGAGERPADLGELLGIAGRPARQREGTLERRDGLEQLAAAEVRESEALEWEREILMVGPARGTQDVERALKCALRRFGATEREQRLASIALQQSDRGVRRAERLGEDRIRSLVGGERAGEVLAQEPQRADAHQRLAVAHVIGAGLAGVDLLGALGMDQRPGVLAAELQRLAQ